MRKRGLEFIRLTGVWLFPFQPSVPVVDDGVVGWVKTRYSTMSFRGVEPNSIIRTGGFNVSQFTLV